jgi:hypothetical protein
MASIAIDPVDMCVLLVCGAGESDVTFLASAMYKAWVDWVVLSDNSKYLPAFNSAGGDPVGAAALDSVYFLQTANGWKICPQTTELSVTVRINGNLYPDVVGAALFDYDEVAAGGHTHVETTVSTSARAIETGGSSLNAEQNNKLMALTGFEATSESGQTYGKQARDMRAVLLGKTSGGGTTTETFLAADGVTTRVVSENDGSNRTTVTVGGS